MYSKFERFLMDSKANDEVFDSSSHQIQVHKEKYDNRFDIIYFKQYSDNIINQSRYEVGGFYDNITLCLYETDRRISEKIPEDSIIKMRTFSEVGKEFLNKLKEYLIEYSFKHEKELKEIAKEKYEAKDDYRINSFKKDVRRLFLSQPDSKISLPVAISDYEITKKSEYNKMLIQYIDNPLQTISDYSKELLKDYGEDFGLELLIYYDKIDYLDEIRENKDNVFKDLYTNKRILDSIRDLDANNINITIKYGENTLAFKYDYDDLKRDLVNGELKSTRLYNSGYDKISDFVKSNSGELYKNSYDRVGFDFANIESISYGKKELYIKENMNKEQEKEEEIKPEI